MPQRHRRFRLPNPTNILKSLESDIPPPPIFSQPTYHDNHNLLPLLQPPAAFIALSDIPPPKSHISTTQPSVYTSPLSTNIPPHHTSVTTLNKTSSIIIPQASGPSLHVQSSSDSVLSTLHSNSSSSSKDNGQTYDGLKMSNNHKKKIYITNAVAAAAIVAIKNNHTEMEAMFIAAEAGKKATNLYSKVISSNKPNSNMEKGITQSKGSGAQQGSDLTGTKQKVTTIPGSTNNATSSGTPWYSSATTSMSQTQTSLPDVPKNAVKKRAIYSRGTASESYRSLAGELPEYFKNKVLVISPVSKELNKNQLKDSINKIAGKDIDFLSDFIILSKTYQSTRTIAIELNDKDYRILSDTKLWNPNMKLSEFNGRRFWRNNNLRLSPTERKNAMKDSWNQ